MTKLETLEDIREKGIKDICKNLKVDAETLCSFGQLGMMSVEALVTTFLRYDLKRSAIKDLVNIYELEKILKIKLNDKIVGILSKYIMWKSNIREDEVK